LLLPSPGVLLKRILLAMVLLSIGVYAGDSLWLRLRIAYPKAGAAFGSVHRYRVYAIPLKNGKTEFQMDANQPEETLPCVHSLFPHLSYSPCWYLQRNTQQSIPMTILPRNFSLDSGSRTASEDTRSLP
jgi:hypothetical protein